MAKRDRKSRYNNSKLYCLLDLNENFNDTRYYGVFRKNGGIQIDPKRFNKQLPNKIDDFMPTMSKRYTTYFIPEKRVKDDYNLNIFFDTISEIRNEWNNVFSKYIKDMLSMITNKSHKPTNDFGIYSGIENSEEAHTNAYILNQIESVKYNEKSEIIIVSIYAQFVHMMASKIEAVTVRVLNKNKVKVNKSLRAVLNGTLINKASLEELKGFDHYDALYRLWNFLKHNNDDVYSKLKLRYPNYVKNVKYESGNFAINFVVFNFDMINDLLNGISDFFEDYCRHVFDENSYDASWNYDAFFIDIIEKEQQERFGSNEDIFI